MTLASIPKARETRSSSGSFAVLGRRIGVFAAGVLLLAAIVPPCEKGVRGRIGVGVHLLRCQTWSYATVWPAADLRLVSVVPLTGAARPALAGCSQGLHNVMARHTARSATPAARAGLAFNIPETGSARTATAPVLPHGSRPAGRLLLFLSMDGHTEAHRGVAGRRSLTGETASPQATRASGAGECPAPVRPWPMLHFAAGAAA